MCHECDVETDPSAALRRLLSSFGTLPPKAGRGPTNDDVMRRPFCLLRGHERIQSTRNKRASFPKQRIQRCVRQLASQASALLAEPMPGAIHRSLPLQKHQRRTEKKNDVAVGLEIITDAHSSGHLKTHYTVCDTVSANMTSAPFSTVYIYAQN